VLCVLCVKTSYFERDPASVGRQARRERTGRQLADARNRAGSIDQGELEDGRTLLRRDRGRCGNERRQHEESARQKRAYSQANMHNAKCQMWCIVHSTLCISPKG
jgi:hypothetical protein